MCDAIQGRGGDNAAERPGRTEADIVRHNDGAVGRSLWRRDRGGHQGVNSEAFSLITPPNGGSGGGSCLPLMVVVPSGDPTFVPTGLRMGVAAAPVAGVCAVAPQFRVPPTAVAKRPLPSFQIVRGASCKDLLLATNPRSTRTLWLLDWQYFNARGLRPISSCRPRSRLCNFCKEVLGKRYVAGRLSTSPTGIHRTFSGNKRRSVPATRTRTGWRLPSRCRSRDQRFAEACRAN